MHATCGASIDSLPICSCEKLPSATGRCTGDRHKNRRFSRRSLRPPHRTLEAAHAGRYGCSRRTPPRAFPIPTPPIARTRFGRAISQRTVRTAFATQEPLSRCLSAFQRRYSPAMSQPRTARSSSSVPRPRPEIHVARRTLHPHASGLHSARHTLQTPCMPTQSVTGATEMGAGDGCRV